MRERLPLILKVVCAALAALLVVRVAGAVTRVVPPAAVALPKVPTWAPAPPTPPGAEGETAAGVAGPPAPPSPPAGPPGPSRPPRGGGPPMAMGGGPGGPGGPGAVPPVVQKRFDRIVQSGLLGPVFRPPPMALMGIAGQDVLLRGPNGQTGLLREGEELGGVKLLKIGTNRVLVREGETEKELMIFGGLGGESLLAKPKENQP